MERKVVLILLASLILLLLTGLLLANKNFRDMNRQSQYSNDKIGVVVTVGPQEEFVKRAATKPDEASSRCKNLLHSRIGY